MNKKGYTTDECLGALVVIMISSVIIGGFVYVIWTFIQML